MIKLMLKHNQCQRRIQDFPRESPTTGVGANCLPQNVNFVKFEVVGDALHGITVYSNE